MGKRTAAAARIEALVEETIIVIGSLDLNGDVTNKPAIKLADK
jgi:hypothetical protein